MKLPGKNLSQVNNPNDMEESQTSETSEFNEDSKLNVWIVDDHVEMSEICAEALGETFKTEIFHSSTHAFDVLDNSMNSAPDILLTDYKMPFLDGIELCKKTLHKYPQISVFLMTGAADYNLYKNAVALGVSGVLEKPFEDEQLKLMLRRATLNKIQTEIEKKIINSLNSTLEHSESLLQAYVNRYIKAENALLDNPLFWQNTNLKDRKKALDDIYHEFELARLWDKNRELLSNLLKKKRYLDYLLNDTLLK
jgi:FixJ family two-component response regulator